MKKIDKILLIIALILILAATIVVITMCTKYPLAQCLFFYVHTLFLLFLISIPLHPCWLLKYTMFVPLILPAIWIAFSACPLTVMHDDIVHKNGYIYTLIDAIAPGISLHQARAIDGLIVLAIVYAASYKRWKMCK
jgi:hypothetical protein